MAGETAENSNWNDGTTSSFEAYECENSNPQAGHSGGAPTSPSWISSTPQLQIQSSIKREGAYGSLLTATGSEGLNYNPSPASSRILCRQLGGTHNVTYNQDYYFHTSRMWPAGFGVTGYLTWEMHGPGGILAPHNVQIRDISSGGQRKLVANIITGNVTGSSSTGFQYSHFETNTDLGAPDLIAGPSDSSVGFVANSGGGWRGRWVDLVVHIFFHNTSGTVEWYWRIQNPDGTFGSYIRSPNSKTGIPTIQTGSFTVNGNPTTLTTSNWSAYKEEGIYRVSTSGSDRMYMDASGRQLTLAAAQAASGGAVPPPPPPPTPETDYALVTFGELGVPAGAGPKADNLVDDFATPPVDITNKWAVIPN